MIMINGTIVGGGLLVIDARYANGQVTTEDYRERLRVLGRGA